MKREGDSSVRKTLQSGDDTVVQSREWKTLRFLCHYVGIKFWYGRHRVRGGGLEISCQSLINYSQPKGLCNLVHEDNDEPILLNFTFSPTVYCERNGFLFLSFLYSPIIPTLPLSVKTSRGFTSTERAGNEKCIKGGKRQVET